MKEPSEIELLERIERGEKASAVMADEFFQNIMASFEADALTGVKRGGQDIYGHAANLRLLDDIRCRFMNIAEIGRVSREKLNHIRSRG